ncbi:acyltransferase [Fusobacteria bacterium ZRK30]|nr:acyltransferase [Fusobacteria bacterium ZRK30]
MIKYKEGLLYIGLRYCLIKNIIESCGENIMIGPNVTFKNIEGLSLENNISIHNNCYIDSEGGILIRDNVSIAHNTSILSSNHFYMKNDIPIKYQGMELKKTIINSNVWIGCGVRVLAGSIISSGCVIGANSVVTSKKIERDTVYVGIPIKMVKKR